MRDWGQNGLMNLRFEVDQQVAMDRGFGLVDSTKTLDVNPETFAPGLWPLIEKRIRNGSVMQLRRGKNQWEDDAPAPGVPARTGFLIKAAEPTVAALIEAVLVDEAALQPS